MPRPGRGGGERGDRGREPGRDRARGQGGGERHDRGGDRQQPEGRKPEPEAQRSEPERQGRPAQGQRPRDERRPQAAEKKPERERERNRPDRQGAPDRVRPGGQRAGHREDPAADDGPAGPQPTAIAVGTTQNKPELVETLPIATAPGSTRVVLSLGPQTKSEAPLPELAGGDRLLAFAELELTTDAEDPNHPGLIGNAYSYAPNVTATLVLAASPDAVDGIELSNSPWTQVVTHQRHHAVVTFGDAEKRLPRDWEGPAYVNLVVDASHPEAKPGDVLLVGQNEKTPTVVQDMAGIRVVRFRPGDAPEPARESQTSCLCAGIPIAKRETVVLSHEIADLQPGEQLLVRARLVTDAAGLAAPARISTRLFFADGPDQTEPGGAAAGSVTWKGHLSKFTGFNCVPGEGPQTSSKYGVAAVRQAPGRSLHVNLVAVSAAPFGGNAPTDELPIDTGASALEITRLGTAT